MAAWSGEESTRSPWDRDWINALYRRFLAQSGAPLDGPPLLAWPPIVLLSPGAAASPEARDILSATESKVLDLDVNQVVDAIYVHESRPDEPPYWYMLLVGGSGFRTHVVEHTDNQSLRAEIATMHVDEFLANFSDL